MNEIDNDNENEWLQMNMTEMISSDILCTWNSHVFQRLSGLFPPQTHKKKWFKSFLQLN